MDASKRKIQVTGTGVVTPIGIGIGQYSESLKSGNTNFSLLEFENGDQPLIFPVAKVDNFNLYEKVSELSLNETLIQKVKRLRNISTSTAYAVYCAMEAWSNAGLDGSVDPSRIAIVSSGSNIQQATAQSFREKYQDRLQYISPYYGLSFFDSDVIGVLSELLGITGEGYLVGAASASGNVAIINGCRLISSDTYDIVLVVAPLMELSAYEFQGFSALGAMALANDQEEPDTICKPFDVAHCGFVYGQSAGCLVLESELHAAKREKTPYGSVSGYGICMDANRNPNPSTEGEIKAMVSALKSACLNPSDIDYVNTHGTASKIGDQTEVEALLATGLKRVSANSTKSLIGHGLSAAGVVEAITCLLQMQQNFLHPTHNLKDPLTNDINWIRGKAEPAVTHYAMSNSFGFGGINTSIVFRNN
jgi:malonyl-ACP decarboxylase